LELGDEAVVMIALVAVKGRGFCRRWATAK